MKVSPISLNCAIALYSNWSCFNNKTFGLVLEKIQWHRSRFLNVRPSLSAPKSSSSRVVQFHSVKNAIWLREPKSRIGLSRSSRRSISTFSLPKIERQFSLFVSKTKATRDPDQKVQTYFSNCLKTAQFHTSAPCSSTSSIKMESAAANKSFSVIQQQNFDFFLVLDFEATCDSKNQPKPQEIIEFPVLKVNAKTGKIESRFHQYVLPQYHPQLTPFCTELTGIIQSMVDNQPHLPEVLQNFNAWMLQEGLLETESKSIFVTCGDWDLKIMLPKECAFLELVPKAYFKQWINIKRSFAEATGTFPKGMMPMLGHYGIKHVGRHHSGIDDCENIANILVHMLHNGYVFTQNGRWH